MPKSLWKAVSAAAIMSFICAPSTMAAAQDGATNEAPVDQTEEASEEAPLVNERVVVTARRMDEAQQFVEQLSAAPRFAEQLSRWNKKICPTVVGLPAEQGQLIVDQIALRAMDIGLRPEKPGCDGNIIVFVTADGNELAQGMFEKDSSVFAYYDNDNTSTMGRDAFDDFLNTPRAVRWWHVSQTVSKDGIPLKGDAIASGFGDGFSNAPTVRSNGSRLEASVRQDLARVIIIVDASKTQGVSLSTLADYISMVALAQIDPNANTRGLETVMNLFETGEEADTNVKGMTQWDVAYLDSLYKAKRNAVNIDRQRNEIAMRIQKSPS
ncbi:hypothetical protein WNY37_06265 [Henriciella sp. AS95]|uniref:hypothetical protein n=1 Tax=Henriciella sp. AS95 TaxID=3135782 RepID=UPI00316C85D1